jgi:hypothetical protein
MVMNSLRYKAAPVNGARSWFVSASFRSPWTLAGRHSGKAEAFTLHDNRDDIEILANPKCLGEISVLG